MPPLQGVTDRYVRLITWALEDVDHLRTQPQAAGPWLPLATGERWYWQARGIVHDGQSRRRRRGFIGIGSSLGAVLATAAATSVFMSRKFTPRHSGTAMITDRRFLFCSPSFSYDAPLQSIRRTKVKGLNVLCIKAKHTWLKLTYQFHFADRDQAETAKSWLDAAIARNRTLEASAVKARLKEAHRLAADAAGSTSALSNYIGHLRYQADQFYGPDKPGQTTKTPFRPVRSRCQGPLRSDQGRPWFLTGGGQRC